MTPPLFVIARSFAVASRRRSKLDEILRLRSEQAPQSQRLPRPDKSGLAMTRGEGLRMTLADVIEQLRILCVDFFQLVLGQLSFFELLSIYLPRGSFRYAVYKFNSLRKLKISQVVVTKIG